MDASSIFDGPQSSRTQESEVLAKTIAWWCEDFQTEEGKRFKVIIWAQTLEEEVVSIVIEDSLPFIEVKLPEEFNAAVAETLCANIFDALKQRLYNYDPDKDHRPVSYQGSFRLPLFYYSEERHICMQLNFKSMDAARHCQNLLQWPVKTSAFGAVKLTPTATKIPMMVKFRTQSKLLPCQWVRFSGSQLDSKTPGDTNCRSEYKVSHRNIKQCSEDECSKLGDINPSFLIFDDEMFSKDALSFPDEHNAQDVVFMEGAIYASWNKHKGEYDIREFLLVLVPLDPPKGSPWEGVAVGEMPKNVTNGQSVKPRPPPLTKASFGRIKGNKLVRIPNPSKIQYDIVEDEERDVEIMVFNTELDFLAGSEQLQIDLNPTGVIGHNSIEFDHKYKKVRKGRLGEPYQNLSRLRKWIQGWTYIEWSSSAYHDQKIWVPDGPGRIYFDTYKMVQRDYKEDSYNLDVLGEIYLGIGKHKWSPAQIFESYRTQDAGMMRETGVYCMRDVWCTWGLFQHFNFWTSYSGMANVMEVDIFDLFSQGQSVRTRAQTYSTCNQLGHYMLIPERQFRSIAGGHVFDQIPGLYEFLLLLDFMGLYPSIMRKFNISPDTDDNGKKRPDEDCYIMEWKDKHGDWSTRFVKEHIRKGILPVQLEHLTDARNLEKKRMADAKKRGDKKAEMIHNVNQNGYKVSSNSKYGAISQKGGTLGHSEAGAAVTAYGRMLVQKMGRWCKENGWEVIYGDSVTGRTPIFVRFEGREGMIMTIQNFYDFCEERRIENGQIKPKSFDGKEYVLAKNLEVWSEKGWTKVENVMRHKTTKKIYQVMTENGYVEVTEDHSLLRDDGKEITPKEVGVGERLLTSYPDEFRFGFSDEDSYSLNDQRKAADHYARLKTLGYEARLEVKDGRMFVMKGDEKSTGKVKMVKVLEDHSFCEGTGESDGSAGPARYVYDLTTANHHFQAGVGDIIVHNTDSVMIRKIGGLTDDEKRNFEQIGKDLVKKLNAECFESPIEVQLDGMMRTFVSLSKKMYTKIAIDPADPLRINPQLFSSKGFVTSRRDTCLMCRNLCKKMARDVTAMKPLDEVLVDIANEIERLIYGQVTTEELITILKLGPEYKNANNQMALYQKHLLENGILVKAGDRLPHVYVKRAKSRYKGDTFEYPEIYERNKDTMELDRVSYLKSQFANKIDTYLHACYPDYIPEEFIAKIPGFLELRKGARILEVMFIFMEVHMKKVSERKVEEKRVKDEIEENEIVSDGSE